MEILLWVLALAILIPFTVFAAFIPKSECHKMDIDREDIE